MSGWPWLGLGLGERLLKKNKCELAGFGVWREIVEEEQVWVGWVWGLERDC